MNQIIPIDIKKHIEKYKGKIHPILDSTSKNQNDIYQFALVAYNAGFSIIPVNRKKQATIKWKILEKVRPSLEQLQEWFANNSNINYAIIAGDISGGFVPIDFDHEYFKNPDGSEDKSRIITNAKSFLDKWAENNPVLIKEIPIVETGRGGFHHYTLLTQTDINLLKKLKVYYE